MSMGIAIAITGSAAAAAELALLALSDIYTGGNNQEGRRKKRGNK
jgi:hypothetical protein